MITSDQHKSEPVVRRMEVFTGAGHRREWPAEVKARNLAETMAPGETVRGVARRHGLRVDQLFAWRKAARRAAERAEGGGVGFAPVVVASPEIAARAGMDREPRPAGLIEVDVGAGVVRIGRGAEPVAITAVIRALRRRA